MTQQSRAAAQPARRRSSAPRSLKSFHQNDTWYPLPGAGSASFGRRGVVAFSQIQSMLFGMVLPPSLEAEMYHALALIPTVHVTDNVKDIAGRAGVAFVLPPTKQSLQLGIILDASDYHLLAQASWDNPRNPSTLSETAILKEYLVAELGSTQPSTTPPSAAELAAERIYCAPAARTRKSGRPPTTRRRLSM